MSNLASPSTSFLSDLAAMPPNPETGFVPGPKDHDAVQDHPVSSDNTIESEKERIPSPTPLSASQSFKDAQASQQPATLGSYQPSSDSPSHAPIASPAKSSSQDDVLQNNDTIHGNGIVNQNTPLALDGHDAHPSSPLSQQQEKEPFDPNISLADYDWDDLEARFHVKMEQCTQSEEEIEKDFKDLLDVRFQKPPFLTFISPILSCGVIILPRVPFTPKGSCRPIRYLSLVLTIMNGR